MEEAIEKKPLEELTSLAVKLQEVQKRITVLNGEMKELESQRGKLSDEIVGEIGKIGDYKDTGGIDLKDIGFVKLTTKPLPKIISIQELMKWSEQWSQPVPELTINFKAFQSWYEEQLKNGQITPPDTIVSVYWKTTARVNKGI